MHAAADHRRRRPLDPHRNRGRRRPQPRRPAAPVPPSRLPGSLMNAYDPREWHDFYVMAGGAAAALTGLLFVAMSLHSKSIMRHPLYGGRAVGTLVSLLTILFISGIVLIPGQSTLAIG